MVGVVAIGLVAAACAPAPPSAPVYDSACSGTLVASTPGTVAANTLTELSGLAASRGDAGVWWGHNDSISNSNEDLKLFAIGDDGRNYAEFTLTGAANVDWEDIAVGPGPAPGVNYVYVGDIGDNAKARGSIVIYRFPEPAVNTGSTGVTSSITAFDTFTFTYPDGPHDAEALIVDPATGDLFVVTKEVSGNAQVFRAPANAASGALTQAATISLGFLHAITAGDVTAAGDVVALRSYWTVFLYPRPAGTPLTDAFTQPVCFGGTPAATISVNPEPQLESIAFTPDGRGYVTAAEGAHPTLHRFTAP